VIQRGEQLGFAPEPREPLRVVDNGRRQELQGDVALQSRVARAVDFSHAAGAERGDDLVGADGRADRGWQAAILLFLLGLFGTGDHDNLWGPPMQ
jgi:hypothetical protein